MSILSKIKKHIFAHSLGFVLSSLIALLVFNPLSAGAQDTNSVTYGGKTYGSEHFFAITGEVYGEAAPGVEAVYVNGQKIPVNENFYFSARVSLPQGQKYLSIETEYQGLRYIKKYLVIRNPEAQKSFKIQIPKKEFKKILAQIPKSQPKAKPKTKPKKKTIAKQAPPKQKQMSDWIAETFSKIRGQKEEVGLVGGEGPYIIKKENVLILDKDSQKIFEGEIQKFLKSHVSKEETKKIVGKEAKKVVEKEAPKIIKSEVQEFIKNKVSAGEIFKTMQRDAPLILEREIKKIIARDVPTGEGINIVSREIEKVVKKETERILHKEASQAVNEKLKSPAVQKLIQQKIATLINKRANLVINKTALWKTAKEEAVKKVTAMIDKAAVQEIAHQTVIREAQRVSDKNTLRQIARNTIIKETVKIMDQEPIEEIVKVETRKVVMRQIPAIIEAEAQKILIEQQRETEQKRKEQIEAFKTKKLVPPNLPSTFGEKWSDYNLITEIEPGKIFMVAEIDGKYAGYIYNAQNNMWFSLHELNYEELRDLLSQNIVPSIEVTIEIEKKESKK